MSVTIDKTATLRAHQNGHLPIVIQEKLESCLDTKSPGAVCYPEKTGALQARDHFGVGRKDTLSKIVVQSETSEIERSHTIVRRLTPVECERLQGFPDGWTDIPYKGKEHPIDAKRIEALGNSMAVPVMAWIARRIDWALAHPITERKSRDSNIPLSREERKNGQLSLF